MHFEHTTDEIVGWLKETEFENSEFIPNDVTSAEIDKSKFILNGVLFRTRRRVPKKNRSCRECHDGQQAGHHGSQLKCRRIGIGNLEKHSAACKRRDHASGRKVAQTTL